MASGAGYAITMNLACLRIIISRMAAKAFRWAAFFLPGFLENRIADRLAMGTRLPVGNDTLMALKTITPDRSLLLRWTRFTDSDGQDAGHYRTTKTYYESLGVTIQHCSRLLVRPGLFI
jgi:hypothetical protein